MSLISGNTTFGADAINCSSNSIIGAAAFIDGASNEGAVALASFADTAVNLGSVQTATFTGSASNVGSVDAGIFVGSASNEGTVVQASFSESASNEGSVDSATFSDGAVNVGTLTSGTFLGTAVNSGVVTVAEFFGTASNFGVIVEEAKFADTSSNVGIVSGSAIFADTSVSDGIVEGEVQIAQTATQGANQALTETPTEYTQPDGFYPNGHYSGGSKTAPANYQTVVHEIGVFWYKYDASGNGSLASGNYNDGTSLFTFANGIKGNAYTPPAGNWYDDTSTPANVVTLHGTVTESDEGSGVVAALFDGSTGYMTVDAIGSEFDFSSGDSTIEFWVKPESNAFGSILFGESGGTLNIHTYGDGNIHINDASSADIAVPVSLNTWQHIAVVISSGQKYVYLNGTLFGSSSQLFGSTNTLTIGRFDSSNYFDGSIAGLRIVKGTAVYTNNFSPTSVPTNVSGTELLLNFGATDVPTYTPVTIWYEDTSSAARTVTKTGTVTQTDLGNGVVAATFAGGGVLKVQNSSAFNFGDGDFTVEFFFRRSTFTSGGEEAIVTTADPTDATGIYLGMGISNGATNAIGLYGGSGGWGFFLYQYALFHSNSWAHIAAVRHNGQFRLYANGVLLGTDDTAITLTNSNNSIQIGGRSVASQYFNGDVASVRVVKGTALYTGSTYTVPTSLLTAVANTELLLNFGATDVPTIGNLSGPYSQGYASNDIIDVTYTNSTPQQAQDNSSYYTYALGVATLAEGRYSNGAYVAGAIDTGGTYDGEGTAQDDSNTYTYSAGAIVP